MSLPHPAPCPSTLPLNQLSRFWKWEKWKEVAVKISRESTGTYKVGGALNATSDGQTYNHRNITQTWQGLGRCDGRLPRDGRLSRNSALWAKQHTWPIHPALPLSACLLTSGSSHVTVCSAPRFRQTTILCYGLRGVLVSYACVITVYTVFVLCFWYVHISNCFSFSLCHFIVVLESLFTVFH